METKFQTSFIPKTTIGNGPSTSVKRPVNFFIFISGGIFLASTLLAGLAFGALRYFENQRETMKADLDKNIKAFEQPTLEKYARLDLKMNTAESLLSKHIAVSNILSFLSESTLKSVRFSDFEYSFSDDGSIALNMSGAAKNYNGVAYQSRVFGKSKDLLGPLFSDIDLNDKGEVTFSFLTKINPSLVYYINSLNKDNANNLDLTPSELEIEAVSGTSTATTTNNRAATSTRPAVPRSTVR